jgi:hypothetical protein
MNPYRDPIPGERGNQNPLRRPAIAIFLSLVTAGVVRLAMTFVVDPSAISKTAWSYAIVSLCAVAILVWKVIYARLYDRWVAYEVAKKMAELDASEPRARIALAPDAHQVRAGEGAEADLGEELGEAHHRHVR